MGGVSPTPALLPRLLTIREVHAHSLIAELSALGVEPTPDLIETVNNRLRSLAQAIDAEVSKDIVARERAVVAAKERRKQFRH